MNVLLLIDQNGCRWSSQEDFCLSMVRRITSRGGLCMAAYSSSPCEEVRERLEGAGGMVAVLSRKSSPLPGFCRQIRRVCREHDISVIHLMHYPPSTALTLLIPYAVPASVILSDYNGGFGIQRGSLKQAAFRYYNRAMNSGIASFIAPSEFIAHRLGTFRELPAGKIATIMNGVDLVRFSPEGHRDETRRGLVIATDALIILTAANLYPLKGIDLLIKAYSRIAGDFPACRLIIAGDGPERVNLERLAADLAVGEKVSFLGQRSDMPDLLAAADIFCSPSIWGEAFGWVNAEAMACAVPVVSVANGAIPEVVAHGVCGLLVSLDDEAELADALRLMIADPGLRERMGAAGRKRAERLFDLRRNIDEHVTLYEKVVAD